MELNSVYYHVGDGQWEQLTWDAKNRRYVSEDGTISVAKPRTEDGKETTVRAQWGDSEYAVTCTPGYDPTLCSIYDPSKGNGGRVEIRFGSTPPAVVVQPVAAAPVAAPPPAPPPQAAVPSSQPTPAAAASGGAQLSKKELGEKVASWIFRDYPRNQSNKALMDMRKIFNNFSGQYTQAEAKAKYEAARKPATVEPQARPVRDVRAPASRPSAAAPPSTTPSKLLTGRALGEHVATWVHEHYKDDVKGPMFHLTELRGRLSHGDKKGFYSVRPNPRALDAFLNAYLKSFPPIPKPRPDLGASQKIILREPKVGAQSAAAAKPDKAEARAAAIEKLRAAEDTKRAELAAKRLEDAEKKAAAQREAAERAAAAKISAADKKVVSANQTVLASAKTALQRIDAISKMTPAAQSKITGTELTQLYDAIKSANGALAELKALPSPSKTIAALRADFESVKNQSIPAMQTLTQLVDQLAGAHIKVLHGYADDMKKTFAAIDIPKFRTAKANFLSRFNKTESYLRIVSKIEPQPTRLNEINVLRDSVIKLDPARIIGSERELRTRLNALEAVLKTTPNTIYPHTKNLLAIEARLDEVRSGLSAAVAQEFDGIIIKLRETIKSQQETIIDLSAKHEVRTIKGFTHATQYDWLTDDKNRPETKKNAQNAITALQRLFGPTTSTLAKDLTWDDKLLLARGSLMADLKDRWENAKGVLRLIEDYETRETRPTVTVAPLTAKEKAEAAADAQYRPVETKLNAIIAKIDTIYESLFDKTKSFQPPKNIPPPYFDELPGLTADIKRLEKELEETTLDIKVIDALEVDRKRDSEKLVDKRIEAYAHILKSLNHISSIKENDVRFTRTERLAQDVDDAAKKVTSATLTELKLIRYRMTEIQKSATDRYVNNDDKTAFALVKKLKPVITSMDARIKSLGGTVPAAVPEVVSAPEPEARPAIEAAPAPKVSDSDAKMTPDQFQEELGSKGLLIAGAETDPKKINEVEEHKKRVTQILEAARQRAKEPGMQEVIRAAESVLKRANSKIRELGGTVPAAPESRPIPPPAAARPTVPAATQAQKSKETLGEELTQANIDLKRTEERNFTALYRDNIAKIAEEAKRLGFTDLQRKAEQTLREANRKVVRLGGVAKWPAGMEPKAPAVPPAPAAPASQPTPPPVVVQPTAPPDDEVAPMMSLEDARKQLADSEMEFKKIDQRLDTLPFGELAKLRSRLDEILVDSAWSKENLNGKGPEYKKQADLARSFNKKVGALNERVAAEITSRLDKRMASIVAIKDRAVAAALDMDTNALASAKSDMDRELVPARQELGVVGELAKVSYWNMDDFTKRSAAIEKADKEVKGAKIDKSNLDAKETAAANSALDALRRELDDIKTSLKRNPDPNQLDSLDKRITKAIDELNTLKNGPVGARAEGILKGFTDTRAEIVKIRDTQKTAKKYDEIRSQVTPLLARAEKLKDTTLDITALEANQKALEGIKSNLQTINKDIPETNATRNLKNQISNGIIKIDGYIAGLGNVISVKRAAKNASDKAERDANRLKESVRAENPKVQRGAQEGQQDIAKTLAAIRLDHIVSGVVRSVAGKAINYENVRPDIGGYRIPVISVKQPSNNAGRASLASKLISGILKKVWDSGGDPSEFRILIVSHLDLSGYQASLSIPQKYMPQYQGFADALGKESFIRLHKIDPLVVDKTEETKVFTDVVSIFFVPKRVFSPAQQAYGGKVERRIGGVGEDAPAESTASPEERIIGQYITRLGLKSGVVTELPTIGGGK